MNIKVIQLQLLSPNNSCKIEKLNILLKYSNKAFYILVTNFRKKKLVMNNMPPL